ncbi:MAG: hypothetical protein EZS28_001957 [Streblomastix strix]|uniref:Protein kinase domain-containing protein n=2 Tax=Streblomastix strix TaxID=222440 RepID=A0A5J4X6X7_9EUKA|nr:MAG: hypothetical protein EZS28_001957 [Streblomastix strix]
MEIILEKTSMKMDKMNLINKLVLKIADFGLIKEQQQVEQSTLMTVAGTMPLMSREMLMGTEDGEVKADSKV